MFRLPAPSIERRPLGIPIEWDSAIILAIVVDCLDSVILNSTSALGVEQSKCDLVFCVWFGKEGFESGPIVQIQLAGLATIRNTE